MSEESDLPSSSECINDESGGELLGVQQENDLTSEWKRVIFEIQKSPFLHLLQFEDGVDIHSLFAKLRDEYTNEVRVYLVHK